MQKERELNLEAIVGRKSVRAREQLATFPYPEALELIDEVPKPAALKIMRAAVLLIINDTTLHRYRPTKPYDYLETRCSYTVTGGENRGVGTPLRRRLRRAPAISREWQTPWHRSRVCAAVQLEACGGGSPSTPASILPSA